MSKHQRPDGDVPDDAAPRGLTEALEDLVRRLVRDELQQGNLNRLIEAQRRVDASFTLSVTPRLSMGVDGPKTVVGAGKVLDGEANVVVEPVVEAEAHLVPEILDAIRSAIPRLAEEIQARPDRATAMINLFTALVQALNILFGQHPATPVTTVVNVYDHSIHVTNQTVVVNPPPPPN